MEEYFSPSSVASSDSAAQSAASVAPEEESLFNFQNIMSLVILYWKWFIFSVIMCLGIAYAYLRYATPVYQATTKMLVKDDDSNRRPTKNMIQSVENLGIMSNSAGIDNEMEIIASHSIALDAVKRMKLYTTYKREGTIVNRLIYKIQPVNVDLDGASLDALKYPVEIALTFKDGKYTAKGKYTMVYQERPDEERTFDTKLPMLPSRIKTGIGYLTFMRNKESVRKMKDGETLFITIVPPEVAANIYVNKLSVEPTSKMTSIARITLTDENPQRAIDYLNQLVVSYNDEANDDKNAVAIRTEEFINSRLEKINNELGLTEGQLESFKRQNKVVEMQMNATSAFTQSNAYDQKLAEIETQIDLFNSISEIMNSQQNKYQLLPSNIGLTDPTAVQLINTYNQVVLERNKLLRSVSESNPSVLPLTDQLNELAASIRRAITQTTHNYDIQRQSLLNQYTKYNSQVQQSPMQERILTQIGRQQEVRSGLYLMLLQKREENSISLAATADKGKLIDAPAYAGKISPRSTMVMLIALLLGLLLPLGILLLRQFLRYKIESHSDVEKLTRLPIVADIPVASKAAKQKADIVVRENSNSMMEEVFRSLRTNMQFQLKENEKTILFTSSTSGEGKSFIASNLAVSFALLGKKVVLVGLDIRKPRLAELFGLPDESTGITNLLVRSNPTREDIQAEMHKSDTFKNLTILPAGPIPPNPAELISRKSLDVVFDILKEDFDYIIIDTSPVGLVTDTLSIGRVANASIYVCRAEYTPKASFMYINELADGNKLPNISVAINGIDLSKKKFGYYYGYGTYGKFGNYSRNYGHYGHYGSYGHYGHYGHYGNYSQSHYGSKDDNSFKK